MSTPKMNQQAFLANQLAKAMELASQARFFEALSATKTDESLDQAVADTHHEANSDLLATQMTQAIGLMAAQEGWVAAMMTTGMENAMDETAQQANASQRNVSANRSALFNSNQPAKTEDIPVQTNTAAPAA